MDKISDLKSQQVSVNGCVNGPNSRAGNALEGQNPKMFNMMIMVSTLKYIILWPCCHFIFSYQTINCCQTDRLKEHFSLISTFHLGKVAPMLIPVFWSPISSHFFLMSGWMLKFGNADLRPQKNDFFAPRIVRKRSAPGYPTWCHNHGDLHGKTIIS